MNEDHRDDDRINRLEAQVRILRRVVVALSVIVCLLLLLDRHLERIVGGMLPFVIVVGVLIGLLVLIFGGAHWLERRFPPK